jgi:hypothetical protein
MDRSRIWMLKAEGRWGILTVRGDIKDGTSSRWKFE